MPVAKGYDLATLKLFSLELVFVFNHALGQPDGSASWPELVVSYMANNRPRSTRRSELLHFLLFSKTKKALKLSKSPSQMDSRIKINNSPTIIVAANCRLALSVSCTVLTSSEWLQWSMKHTETFRDRLAYPGLNNNR